MYTIGIIGAGPAGATLARLLARRCRVLLLDDCRTKCCGGILTPESQWMLAELNLALPKTVLVNPQPYRVAVLDFDNDLTCNFGRQYVNIDRAAFDKWLVSLIPTGVDRRRNARYRSAEKTEHGYRIHFIQDEKECSEEVLYIAGADGANSTLRQEFFPKVPIPKRYIASQYWYDMSESDLSDLPVNFMDDYTGIFSSLLTDFYAWTIPKNEYLILGGAFPFGTQSAEKMELLCQELERRYGLKLPEPVHREAGQVFCPSKMSSVCLGSEKVILLGEAAGLVSPSSAEGISSALISAYHLSESFSPYHGYNYRVYRSRMRGQRFLLYLKGWKRLAMFRPWLRKWTLLSRMTAIRNAEK
ncbi:MAG: FAD-binding protein [Planctomycetaceae bacterium]|jgi:flavin-dependent dehydrogenase|nr:FAD-binding protein [Planctomycetaceae bacterium]